MYYHQQSTDDTIELLLLCSEAGKGRSNRRSIREFLIPNTADDEALKAIKADVRRGLYSETIPLTTRLPRKGERVSLLTT